MYQVGLTGGIASGKSTVSTMLAAHGAVIVDADRIAREVVEPGRPALDEIVHAFGEEMLQADGTLDREALGAVVFADADANATLRAITYPRIGATIAERIEAERGTDHVVVLDAALLVESGWQGLATLVVVAADPDVQLARMTNDRGLSRDEAEMRLRSQAPLAEKLAKADLVIWNNGTLAELEARVDEVWVELCRRRDEEAA
jgi:dephospho-CoA kinase